MEGLKLDKKEWQDYFDEFNKENHFRLAKIEIIDPAGSHNAVKKMPLNGISIDEKGEKKLSCVEIMLENRRLDDGGHYTHIIERPDQVFRNPGLDGRDEGFVIIDSKGIATKLSFEPFPELSAGKTAN